MWHTYTPGSCSVVQCGFHCADRCNDWWIHEVGCRIRQQWLRSWGSQSVSWRGSGNTGHWYFSWVDFYIFDIFLTGSAGTYTLWTGLQDGSKGIPGSMVAMGLIPNAPYRPCLAVSICLMKLFNALHLCFPHLSVQAFVTGLLCNFHMVPCQPSLFRQFLICYDVYIQIKNGVQFHVLVVLECEGNWRLCNACPACTYKLEGEEMLIFNMLITMDGNDSLKQVLCREMTYNVEGQPLYRSAEWPEGQDVSNNYYLSRECVDRWVKDQIQKVAPAPEDRDEEENPCASHWTNMANKMMAQM